MRDDFGLDDELTRRIRALGQVPIDSAMQSRHLTEMAEAAAAPTLLGTLGSRLRLAAALVVGFMLGTTGLASANALGPLQPIASTAIEAVSPLSIPHPDDAGTARFRGDGEQACEDVEYKNRGSYLKAIRAKYGKDSAELTAAKASDCGKPLASLNKAGDDATETETEDGDAKKSGEANDNAKNDEAPGTKVSECVRNADDDAARAECAPDGKPETPANSGKSGDNRPADAGKPAGAGAEGDANKPETPVTDAPPVPPASDTAADATDDGTGDSDTADASSEGDEDTSAESGT
jgi:hypothetical protein